MSRQRETERPKMHKLIPVDSQSLDEYLHLFENAAILSYARSILEKEKQLSGFSGNTDLIEAFDEQKIISTNLDLPSPNTDENRLSTVDKQNTIDYLKEELSNVRSTLTDVQIQLSQVKSN
ncbi:unnamed protein product [Rotaria sordida]|uniref:Uncharacterized protein n=1 Tax=Rotaria sordida TaxID=392033 RepID=A0A814SJL5_9BILA|nr:unnamed protein product [Rotaria sordida]CAF1379016.1 unnamed protein product [Rotaria sordida]